MGAIPFTFMAKQKLTIGSLSGIEALSSWR